MQHAVSKNSNSLYIISPLLAIITSLYSPYTLANDEMDIIEIHGTKTNHTEHLGSVDALLKEQGVDFSKAGGMSNLPIVNGMMGDRIKVLIDGADITAACANHMNPPLSYVSASQIQAMNVVAGISSVSVAGDNIAGVISVNAMNPEFSDTSSLTWRSGYISAQYRSNNDAKSIGVGASVASKNVSFEYQGAFDDAKSYDDGNGNKVIDTLYRAQNHSLTAAFKRDTQQLSVKLSHQFIPFQGFANQYMDMTNNKSYGLTTKYDLQLDNGEFEAQFNWHKVKHEMGFFTAEKMGMMPMNTDAKDMSYKLKWRFDLNNETSLRLGHEFYDYQIDDWWPAVENSMMMGPNDYININDGRRQRLAVFAELEQQFNTKWQILSGIRVERVRTNTDEVQGYMDSMSMGMGGMGGMGGMMTDVNGPAATAFNSLARGQSDTLIDLSLLARYTLNAQETIEIGLARKNRAPNLYERYSWGVSTMATTMIGWFGDGNGYVGDPALNPETAHTISGRYANTAEDETWQFMAKVWYTKVSDYIDAEVIGGFNAGMTALTERNILQFSNVDATLYGSNLEARYLLNDNTSMGKWHITGSLTTTHGERDVNDAPLYQIKPLQTEIAITQQIGNWKNSLAWQWVAEKDKLDSSRLENMTESYHLVNLNSQYSIENVVLTVSISNLLDEYYELPLGGVSVAEYRADATNGFMQLAGEGRSINLGVSYSF